MTQNVGPRLPRWASSRPLRAFALLGATAFAGACGGDDPPPPFDGGVVYPRATANPQVAFEGQERLVVDLFVAGEDFSGASVRVEDSTGPLDVLDQRCRGERCGVVLRVRDTRGNMGVPVPSPIDAEQHGLLITRGTQDYLALVTVFPLDTIDNSGTTPASIRGVVMASSAETAPGSIFEGTAGGAPARWVIFGEATFGGTVDVSAADAEARAGGASGGSAGDPGGDIDLMGGGPRGGSPGLAGAGGGGGGAIEDGEAGAGADGSALGGGPGGMGSAALHGCASRLEEDSCGGAGGGGASGEGGAGGGGLLIASLGTMRADGAAFAANGGDGAMGGGGGAGGTVLLAAPTLAGAPTVEANAGMGGLAASADTGTGGDGSAGLVRLDAFAGSMSGPAGTTGPAADVAAVESLSDAAMVTITGRAAPGASIEATIMDTTASFTATADSGNGTFSVDVALNAGINRVVISATTDGVTLRSWVGTNYELESIPSLRQALPRGATIDVVHLP